MKGILSWPLLAAFALLAVSCGKQENAAERQAEIDRQVQQRLDAEHQAAEKDTLAQQQADLDARGKALAAKENQTAAATPPEPVEPPATPTAVAPNESGNDTYTTFYRKLDPYGDWIETGDYGYVFQPRPAQSANWRPYTNGHWVYTDAGWTWISDEPFGWATYHYGRWTRLRSVGWVWVPGDEWAPAWVSWRKGNDYVGWAPLPPSARFDRHTGIHDQADSHYGIGPQQYNFVPTNEFGGPQSARVVIPPERNVTIISQTTNVTNITYNNSTVIDRGPSYDDLRARSRHSINRLRLERTQNLNQDRPVLRGEVIAMPAPHFHPAARDARPPRVKRKTPQPQPENGRERIRDHSASQQARTNTPSAATPPPKVQPRKPVRPSPVATATVTLTPTATPSPKATAAPSATATPVLRPSRNRPQQKRVERVKEKPHEPRTKKAAPSASPTPIPSATRGGHARPNRP